MKKTLFIGIPIIIIGLIILYFSGCFNFIKQPSKNLTETKTNPPTPVVIPCPDNGLKNNDTLHVEIITAKKIHKKKSAITKKENTPPPKIEAPLPPPPPPPIIKERKDSLIVVTKIIFDPDSSLQKFVDGLGKLPKSLPHWEHKKEERQGCDTCKIKFIDY